MTDLDKSGYGYQRVRTYLGPSLGWIDEFVQPATEVTVGGTYNVKPGDSLILVDVAALVTVRLPDVTKWVQQNATQPATGFSRSITVKDLGGNAANFNIAVVPFAQQSIDNIQAGIVISTARAVVEFTPLIDMSGWTISSSSTSGGGGGGGGGDVFKAGNNTFTGVNNFVPGTISVPTTPLTDADNSAASTEFVKLQGYITTAALAPYAFISSPVFTGDPQAPTPAPGDNDTSIATTQFVATAIAAIPAGGAPANAEYITAALHTGLSAERVLTNSATVTWDYSVAGQVKATAVGGGGGSGNVSNEGTPVSGQLAQWTSATVIKGVDATSLNFQPLDADLTALAALAGTNTIYYRSADTIWSPVTFSGLSFSGGVLTVTAGGGNVNNSGVPTVLQYARWTDATHIEGVAPGTVRSDIGAAPLNGPVFTGDARAVTPAVGDNDTSIATTAFVQNAMLPSSGRLSQVSTTQLKFVPYNGNFIKINGVVYIIPNAGIAGLLNTGAYVDGTAGQALAANTTYLVCAFSNGGIVTADYRTSLAHQASTQAGNEGVEIATGINTRTVIGMVRTNASSQFSDGSVNRFCISWFNRRNYGMQGAIVSANLSVNSWNELNTAARMEFLTWAEEAVLGAFTSTAYGTVNTHFATAVGIDGATLFTSSVNSTVYITGNPYVSSSGVAASFVGEGYHYFTPIGNAASSSNIVWVYVGVSGMIRG